MENPTFQTIKSCFNECVCVAGGGLCHEGSGLDECHVRSESAENQGGAAGHNRRERESPAKGSVPTGLSVLECSALYHGKFHSLRLGMFSILRLGMFSTLRLGMFSTLRLGMFNFLRLGMFNSLRVGKFSSN